jgi:hypothetical protein
VSNQMSAVFFQWVAPDTFYGEVWIEGIVRMYNHGQWHRLHTVKVVVEGSKMAQIRTEPIFVKRSFLVTPKARITQQSIENVKEFALMSRNAQDEILTIVDENNIQFSSKTHPALSKHYSTSTYPYERLESELGSWNNGHKLSAVFSLGILLLNLGSVFEIKLL